MNGENNAVVLLHDILNKVIASEFENIPSDFKADFEHPKHENQGDIATNAAMRLAKILKTNPKIIAEKIIAALNSNDVLKNSGYVEKIELANPGFINIFLTGKFFAGAVIDVLNQNKNYGALNLGKNKKVQVEFVSANPTGPLHIGHGRGAAVGDVVARVLKFTGWDVQREYYINDAGLQMENLGRSTRARYFELLGHDFAIPENGYKGEYLKDIAQEIINTYGEKFLNVPEDESVAFFRDYAGNKILDGIKKDLKEFRVEFDKYFVESYLHENNLIKSAMQFLKDNNYAYESDGALWFKSTEFGDDKDRVLIRANGVSTYFAADVAYHKNKFDRGFERVIDVWGADHHGYIARVKAGIKATGNDPEKFDVLLIQLVNLLRGGESVNMSTRSGEFVELNEVVNEVGTDAARFFFLTRRSDSQLDFDLDVAKEQTSNNPVYYIQYAHARIAGVLREFENRKKILPDNDFEIPAEIFNDKDARLLVELLTMYPYEISNASENLAPHVLTGYLINLAGAFHAFYNTNVILNEPDEKISAGRLNIIRAVKIVIGSCLELLGVSAPDRM